MKKALLTLSIVLSIILTQGLTALSYSKETYKFEVKPLPYSYDALEPYISKETMTLHHDKHYANYVKNLNAALDKYPDLQNLTLYELLSNLDSLPQDVRNIVRNNGGGVYNHELFFNIMSNKNNPVPTGKLKEGIESTFDSYENFKSEFKKSALDVFGSGWTWLVLDKNNNLCIVNTPNQDNPICCGLKPIIGIDLWEHAYYLDYKNDRSKYIDNWFNVLDWNQALKNYKN
ncbi:superoxide dismutase [Romboutsia sp. Marseille-P6047]|uniref:superoxide dismutase n=1 Tax=Romboutsia sp. Marseille-P6047 TaxID=2161817 RepID=UPI000F05A821|nr:superoxide dismutase [Romboutsia sp. Marseille-P6047]